MSGAETAPAPPRQLRLRRILVAVDASPHSFAALQASAELAGSAGAELVALFIEDENVLRLSHLARAREVGLYSAERHQLDPQSVEQMFREMSARARDFLHRVSREQAVRDVTFRTTRGQVARRLLEEAAGADLVSLGTRGWTPGIQPGSTASRLIREHGAPPVLVLREGLRLGTCPFAVYDGTAAGRKAIQLAALLGAREDARVTVLVPGGGDPKDLELRAQEAEAVLSRGRVGGAIRELSSELQARLGDFLRDRGCGVLVAPRPGPEEGDRRLRELLSSIPCPVILVS